MDIRTGILMCTLLAGCIDRQLDFVLSAGISGGVMVVAADGALVPVEAHHQPLAVSVRLHPSPAILLHTIETLATLERPEDELSPYFDDTDISFRMFGGDEAPIGKYPHMVALTVGASVKTFFCGASLITYRTILSAAHCLRSIEDPVNTIHGTVGTNRWNSGGTTYAFSSIVEHYNPPSEFYKNDLCLFITASNVVFTDRVQPVALSFEYVPAGITCRVAGWGLVSPGRAPDTLMEITTTTIMMPDCAALWSSSLNPVNTETEICTLSSPGRGLCNGDSGGALIRADSGEQIGIFSWMAPCARGFPDVFVRISAYQTWIQANTVW